LNNKVFDNIYHGKKVLITGHTGFKGSWLSLWLIKLGAKVIGVSKDIPTKPSLFDILDLDNKMISYFLDINDYIELKEVFNTEKPDFVFHLAAQAIVSEAFSDPLYTLRTNIIGTANILDCLKNYNKACTSVIITSDKCYDNVEWEWGYRENDVLGGKDIYSGSKGAAELVFKSYFHSYFKNSKNEKIKLASVRAGNVIGGGDWAKDRIIPDCYRSWAQENEVEIRSPKSTRPWQHVLEPLSGYLSVCYMMHTNKINNGESFNFGPRGSDVQVLNLIKDLSKYWNFKTNKSFYKLIDIKNNYHEAKLLKLNCDKANLLLKWHPVLDYDKLVEFTGTWYSKYYNQDNMWDFTNSQIDEFEKLAIKNNLFWIC